MATLTTAKTYRLKAETLRRLEALVTETGAYHSQLIDQLLTRAMDEIDAGRWKLKKKPVKWAVIIE